MNYPEDHPLHGLHPNQASTLAYEHAGSIEGDPVKWGRATIALAYEYKKHLDTVNERHDWLTRAIELSGAPEGSGWAGLLERIGKLQAEKVDSREWFQMVHQCARAMGMQPGNSVHGLVEFARKFRERAEAAERKVNEWKASFDVSERRSAAFEADSNSLHIERNKLKAANEELAQERDRARHQLKWLEAEHNRVIQKQLDATNAKMQAWVDDGATPPLDRIAADVAKIAANVERMVADA